MLTLGNAMYLGIFPRNNQPRILRKNHHSIASDFICFPGNNAAHIIEEFGTYSSVLSEHKCQDSWLCPLHSTFLPDNADGCQILQE